MNKARQYSPEVRERAVRLVFAHEREQLTVGGDLLDCGEDRLLGGDAAQLGAAGRA